MHVKMTDARDQALVDPHDQSDGTARDAGNHVGGAHQDASRDIAGVVVKCLLHVCVPVASFIDRRYRR